MNRIVAAVLPSMSITVAKSIKRYSRAGILNLRDLVAFVISWLNTFPVICLPELTHFKPLFSFNTIRSGNLLPLEVIFSKFYRT